MKVKKNQKPSLPKYPSCRQFSESRTVVGLATLGLTAMTSLGSPAGNEEHPTRLPGDIAVAPKISLTTTTNNLATPPTKKESCSRLMGVVAVQPKPQTPGKIHTESAATNKTDSMVTPPPPVKPVEPKTENAK